MRFSFAPALLALTALAQESPERVLARMDQSATAFRGVWARVKRMQHTAVINENNTDAGALSVKRAKPGDLRMLMEQTDPDVKAYGFQGKKFEIYYPKINTVQEYDVGKQRGLVEQFFLLGFGTPRKDLERDYTIQLAGAEAIAGQKTTRLELTPKSAESLKYLKKVELWIAEATGYPVQQKFHQSGGDYQLVTYSEVRINPDLPDSSLKLKLPRNVKREFPGRQ